MKNITMRLFELYFVVALIAITYSSAIPKQAEHKDRVHETKLSDVDHNADGEHNNDYDHDAFLGKDDAKTFDQLSPEESKERLGKIVEKIDKDKDGKVTESELKDWILYVQKRYIITDTERMWKDHNIDGDKLTWNSYKKRTYGFTDESEVDDPETSKDMVERDDRRWKVADQNNDGFLDKEEFANFLHPEEAEHMRDIVVKETMEDIDKNNDGVISLEEYIEDVYGQDEDDDDTEPDDDGHQDGEPDWVQSERDQFHNQRDKNMDGVLDEAEVRAWIIPEEFDHSSAEANHLVLTSDENKDGFLTKDEILEHYDTFVGSQATDFGEALTKHDEF